MTIAEQVEIFAETQASQPRDERMTAFTREQVAATSFEPARVIDAGETLAKADLLDAQGLATTPGSVVAGRRGVLVLYRGAWCQYGNITLNTYQTEPLSELEERGVRCPRSWFLIRI